jgi:hypothetical protein
MISTAIYCGVYVSEISPVNYNVIALIIGSAALLVVIVWLLNRFRRYASTKITTNNLISERQFWCDPVLTKEQAIGIVRRASRDFIGLSILSFNPFLLILAVLIGKKSIISSFILITIPIVFGVAIVYGALNTHDLTLVLITLPFAASYSVCSWMAWRAFQAARLLR